MGGGDKVYDYTAVFNGFAAQLTAEQASKLELMKDVAVVEKAENVSVDATATTGSSDAFLHLSDNGGLWDKLGGVSKGGLRSGAGEDVVFGDVDGGYWPENPAFSDRKVDGSNGNNYPHKVTGFSGICQAGEAFPASTCNGKVIAARYYVDGMGAANIPDYEYLSPRDYGGHGSHTASTAAGNYGVSATGDAARLRHRQRHRAPRAHRRLQGLLGATRTRPAARATAPTPRRPSTRPSPTVSTSSTTRSAARTTAFIDPVEVSFLNAAAAGVFVTASAGNSGPTGPTVAHPSPWIMTTAAGTHNRDGAGHADDRQRRDLQGARPRRSPCPLTLDQRRRGQGRDSGRHRRDPVRDRRCSIRPRSPARSCSATAASSPGSTRASRSSTQAASAW